jgi:peptide/nickel transport system substrate-binding protein
MLDSGSIPTERAGVGPRSRRILAVALAVALAAGVAACDTAGAADDPDPPKKGGTLRLILSVKIEHMDPQRIAAALDFNISRLYSRTLTTVRSEPGPAASEIVGDLATDTGRPSDGNRVWEFTLKNGVKWQDGAPITCTDLKYGIERNFSSLFTTGLQYPRQLLQDNPTPYEGPFKGDNNNGKGLESVRCLDEKTIQFTLQQPVGDFGYTVALPVFAPVPYGKDEDKDAYDRRPLSSGPYKVAESTDDRVVLDRNPHWQQGTDPVRKAYPDQIVVTVNDNVPLVTYQLAQDQGEAKSSVQLSADIASNFVQQVINDPELSKRLIRGSHSGVRYLAINTRRVKDIRCRQALIFAANKRKFRSALGGSMFGELATSIISPKLRSHKEFDLYNTKSKPEGDRERAIQLLAEAGDACPRPLRIAFPEPVRRLMAPIIESFQRVGIETELIGIDPTKINYFGDGIGRPDNTYDVMWAGWVADWANGSAVIPPLFSGKVIPKGDDVNGNLNFSLLDDQEINRLIDEAMAESNLQTQYALWGELDQKVMERAALIPLLYMNSLRMVGSNVRGAFIHPQFAGPDVTALGVANPEI